ncbi:MAG: aminopeptidase [Chloroflexota bacterium]
MSDPRLENFARLLVDYSTRVKPGDRVAITSTTTAVPLMRAIYARVLEKGGFPHLLLDIPEQEKVFYEHAGDDLLDFVPAFHQIAFEQFDVLIKVRAETNTRALRKVDPARLARHQKAMAQLLQAQVRRGADGSLRWMSTLYPTRAYAKEAGMSLREYEDFVYGANHVDPQTADPVAFWQEFGRHQQRVIDWISGRDRVELRGPNVDLTLSIKDRIFKNSCGFHNLPDGEIFTGPVENSVNGWVRFTYPAIYQGQMVEGIELKFDTGKVVQATARKNEAYLLKMLDSDTGSRYLGEFAIGTNFQIDRFTKSILFDEKIGGTFHMALGAGYPETGSLNKSIIHWDMICDLRTDSEIRVDGDLMYRNGQFVF